MTLRSLRPTCTLGLIASALLACMPPSWGAGALLHPARKPIAAVPLLPHRDVSFDDGGVTLRGWFFPAAGPRHRAAVVYLHGIADNRASGVWIAERLVPLGYDVLVYDGRAHGESGGSACTYGVLERRDLARALDALTIDRAILVGASLGAATAIQAAAGDPRVVGIVAAAPFSDLASIARERAPWFASDAQIREAFALAEREAGFRITDASPVAAAPRVRVPVLLVHGEKDRETRSVHSRRLLDALAGPKRLVLVPGAAHDDALGRAWPEVKAWILGIEGGGWR